MAGVVAAAVVSSGWKADDTEAARWRRSNSACWSAGSFGGDGRVWKVEEKRVMRRGVRRMRRGRRRDIVACVCVFFEA